MTFRAFLKFTEKLDKSESYHAVLRVWNPITAAVSTGLAFYGMYSLTTARKHERERKEEHEARMRRADIADFHNRRSLWEAKVSYERAGKKLERAEAAWEAGVTELRRFTDIWYLAQAPTKSKE